MDNETRNVPHGFVILRPMTPAQRVWLDRRKLGMTQVEFSRHCGVPDWVCGEWELGRPTPHHPIPDLYVRRAASPSEFIALPTAFPFLRHRAGISSAALADKLGVSRPTLLKWEQARGDWKRLYNYYRQRHAFV